MAEARSRHAWACASSVCAAVTNAMRWSDDSPVAVPALFDPWRKEEAEAWERSQVIELSGVELVGLMGQGAKKAVGR